MHDTLQDDNDLLLTSDVAQELGIAKETVLQLHRNGKLSAIRTSKGYRLFKRSDVERLKAARAEKKRA